MSRTAVGKIDTRYTKSSGRLEAGKQVQWEWEMYDIRVPVTAKAVEPNKCIVIEWPGHKGLTTVEWTFKPQEDGTIERVAAGCSAGQL